MNTTVRSVQTEYHRRIWMTWLWLSMLVLTAGCAFGRATLGDEIREQNVTAIKKGMTTRAEVVTLMGAPDRFTQANDRTILQYYRYDMKSSSLLLLLVNLSRFNVKSDDLFILLDQDGIVEDVLFSHRTDKVAFQVWPFGD
jgi:outer membrane protein assembly factor BamE (lipoprotein component of BamABCDE complex)